MLKRLPIFGVLLMVAAALAPTPGWASTPAGNGGGNANNQGQNANKHSAPPMPPGTPISTPPQANPANVPAPDNTQHSVKLTSLPPVTLADKNKTVWDYLFDWGPWAFGLVLAVAGVLQLKLLSVTWNEIKGQKTEMAVQTGILRESVAAAQASANAAMGQIEIVKSKERGQLRIEFDEPDLIYDQKLDGYPLYFNVALDGFTRATIVDNYICAYLADSPATKGKPWEYMDLSRVFTPDSAPFRGVTLIHTEEDIYETRLNPERIQLARDRKLEVYVSGRIRYRDVFGDKWMLHIDRVWYQWPVRWRDGASTGVWKSVDDGRWDFHRKE